MVSRIRVIPILLGALLVALAGWKWGVAKTHQFNAASMCQFVASDHGNKTYIPIAIIGSGPSGASAAIYGSRAMVTTVCFEGSRPGGLLTQTSDVENWPAVDKQAGFDIMEKLKKQAESFGAIFSDETITDVNFSTWPYVLTTEGGTQYHAFSVVIATGANPILLDIPGEQDYFSRGVSTCALCDAAFYKGKEVVIVGGGDSAVEEAMQLAAYASKVTILVRKEKMRAAQAMQCLLQGYGNISVRYNVEVIKVNGDGKKLTSVTLQDARTKETTDFKTDGMFLAIGHKPSTDLFKGKLAMNEAGFLTLTGRTQETSVHGVFAGGDCHDQRYRQAATASGFGVAAGIDSVNFLKEIGFTADMQASIIDHIYAKKE